MISSWVICLNRLFSNSFAHRPRPSRPRPSAGSTRSFSLPPNSGWSQISWISTWGAPRKRMAYWIQRLGHCWIGDYTYKLHWLSVFPEYQKLIDVKIYAVARIMEDWDWNCDSHLLAMISLLISSLREHSTLTLMAVQSFNDKNI